MRKILLLASVALLSFPAFAGEGTEIRIIHEDGSVDVIDIGREAPKTKAHAVKAPEPDPAAVPEKVEAAPEPEPVPAPQKKVAPKKKVVKAKPKPVKPVAAPPAPKVVTPPKLPVQRQVQALGEQRGEEISRSQAIAIAIDYAPPSADVEVFRSSYKGAAAFSVMFKTEGGYHEVVLNPHSGQVLDSRKSEAFSVRSPAPGHLPADLR